MSINNKMFWWVLCYFNLYFTDLSCEPHEATVAQLWPFVSTSDFLPVHMNSSGWYHLPPLQSPIDINSTLAIKKELPDLLAWNMLSDGVLVHMENTGSSVEFIVANDSVKTPSITGGPLKDEFMLHNLHIHWGSENYHGSEHHLNGHSPAIEGHCVLYNNKYGSYKEAKKQLDGLAVLAFFGKIAKEDNPKIERVVKLLPNISTAGSSVKLKTSESIGWFADIVKSHGFYTYPGSLTTPDYSENVVWIVYEKFLHLSARQVAACRELMSTNNSSLSSNNRKVQDFNDRPLVFSVKNIKNND